MRYRLILKDEDIDLSKMDVLEKIDLAETTRDENILEKLAKSENINILNKVTQNPNCPINILKKLAKNKFVNDYAKSNPSYKKYVKTLNLNKLEEIDYMNRKDREQLAKTTSDVNILKKLAEDEYDYTRSAVANNPNTPVDVLRKLAEDRAWWVRRYVSENSSTPTDILKKLAKDEDRDVREFVIYNPNCPVEILKELAKDDNKDVRKEAREELKAKGIRFNSTKKSEINSNNLEFEIIDAEEDGWGQTGGPGFTGIINLEVNLNGTTGTISIEGYDDNFEEYEETAQEYEDNTDNPDEAQELLASLSNQNMKWKTSNEEIKESIEEFLEDEDIELTENEINTIVKTIKQSINKYIKQLFPVNKRILNKADKLWERIYG